MLLLGSTVEVLGDPQVHPQPETFLGNVDPAAPRGVDDETKRFGEAMTYACECDHAVDAQISNTHDPGMRAEDGRPVPILIGLVPAVELLPVHGDREQTRLLCLIDDLVDGHLQLLVAGRSAPRNLGSDVEVTGTDVANSIRGLVDIDLEVVHVDRHTAVRPRFAWISRVADDRLRV